MKALVHVTLKTDFLDPQGKAILHACDTLGYDNVTDVRQGKLFEIRLEATSDDGARAILSELCDKLLANPVIEDYEIVSVES